jgi:hypothetical protein
MSAAMRQSSRAVVATATVLPSAAPSESAAAGNRVAERTAADDRTMTAGSNKERASVPRRAPGATTTQAEHVPVGLSPDVADANPSTSQATIGSVGDDLRKLHKNERRKLDLEDPFR